MKYILGKASKLYMPGVAYKEGKKVLYINDNKESVTLTLNDNSETGFTIITLDTTPEPPAYNRPGEIPALGEEGKIVDIDIDNNTVEIPKGEDVIVTAFNDNNVSYYEDFPSIFEMTQKSIEQGSYYTIYELLEYAGVYLTDDNGDDTSIIKKLAPIYEYYNDSQSMPQFYYFSFKSGDLLEAGELAISNIYVSEQLTPGDKYTFMFFNLEALWHLTEDEIYYETAEDFNNDYIQFREFTVNEDGKSLSGIAMPYPFMIL